MTVKNFKKARKIRKPVVQHRKNKSWVLFLIVALLLSVLPIVKISIAFRSPVQTVAAADDDKPVTTVTLSEDQMNTIAQKAKILMDAEIEKKFSELKNDFNAKINNLPTTIATNEARQRRIRQALIDKAKQDYADKHHFCGWRWLFGVDLMPEVQVFEYINSDPFSYYDPLKDKRIDVPAGAHLFLFPGDINVFELNLGTEVKRHPIVDGDIEQTCKDLIEALQGQNSFIPCWYVDKEYKEAHTNF